MNLRNSDPMDLERRRAVAISQLPESVEEGLLYLQLWTVSCAVWMEMTAVYDGLIAILATARPHPLARRLLARLRAERGELASAHAAVEQQRRSYAEAYEQSRRALRAPGARPLAEPLPRVPATASHAAAVCALQRILAQRFAEVELEDERALESAVELLIHYLLAEHGIMAAASSLRDGLGEQVARSSALPLAGAHELAQAQTPYLLDVFEEELGVRLTCTAEGIEVEDLWRGRLRQRRGSLA